MAGVITVKIESAGCLNAIRKLAADIEADAHRALAVSIENARHRAAETTAFRDRTGEARSTLQDRVDPNPDAYRATLFGLAKHIRFLENGTKPHVIRAKRRRMLRFEVNGQTIFRRMVRHPGTKATHFMFRAVQDEAPHARELLGDFVTASAERFNV